MDEVAADMQEGLLALAVGTGLQVMQSIMAEDVSAACGPDHDPGYPVKRMSSTRQRCRVRHRAVTWSGPRRRMRRGR